MLAFLSLFSLPILYAACIIFMSINLVFSFFWLFKEDLVRKQNHRENEIKYTMFIYFFKTNFLYTSITFFNCKCYTFLDNDLHLILWASILGRMFIFFMSCKKYKHRFQRRETLQLLKSRWKSFLLACRKAVSIQL